MCVHPLNKDVSQAVIGTFFSVPFSKDGRMGRFSGFSLLYVEVYQINVSFLSYCDYCSTCEKSFLTGKECPRECTHCRSPHQKKYIYIYIERERILHGHAEMQNFSSSVEKYFTCERSEIWEVWAKNCIFGDNLLLEI